MLQRILVWDIPTRVFHWSLVISFVGAFVTHESERYRDIHLAFGYLMLGLLAFRIVWGWVGTAHARFGSFLYQPADILSYLRSLPASPKHYIGHNPAGAVAIFLLLGLGLMIGISGVMLDKELGSDEWEHLIEELHEIGSNLMVLTVLVHVAGVLVSSFLHKENLVRSMLTGYKQGDAGSAIQRSYPWLGLMLLVASLSFLFAYLI